MVAEALYPGKPLCEVCLDRPATGELHGSPMCQHCADEELRDA
jgi:hypothetical protein